MSQDAVTHDRRQRTYGGVGSGATGQDVDVAEAGHNTLLHTLGAK